MNDNPLNKLIVDDRELDKEKLTSLIFGNLGISKSGIVIILPGYVELSTKSKIISYLLAKKAAKVMELSGSDLTTTKEIIDKTGLPEGTVKRELHELRQMRLVSNEQGYFVPDYAIHMISIEKRSSTKRKKSTHVDYKSTKRTSRGKMKVKLSDKVEKLLQISQDTIDHGLVELMLRPGMYLERSLAVLKIARDNNINELTPSEIETFLKDKIRAGGIWKSNISLYLGKKGTRYVDRFKDDFGSGFAYRIMAPGENLLEDTIKDFSKEKVQE